MNQKILVSITTIEDKWKEKIDEINKLKIKEVALFPTMLNKKKRKELYELLEKSCVKSIPHIHLRDDFDDKEIEYLIKKFKTKVFNIHPTAIKLLKKSKYKKIIFVENLFDIDLMFNECLIYCGGVCLDVSHYEDYGKLQKNPNYKKFDGLLDKYKIGCTHVSAIGKSIKEIFNFQKQVKRKCFSKHSYKNLHEFDYIKKYKKYLPKYISIELENSIVEQLIARDYIKRILKI